MVDPCTPWRVISFTSILLTLLLLCGCGKKVYPVKGQVVFEDGSPATTLAGYSITLESAESKLNANGIIAADGSFTVGTFEPGDGALLGRHRVAIRPPLPELRKPIAPPMIAGKYGDLGTSMLEVEITAQKNEPTVKVERVRK